MNDLDDWRARPRAIASKHAQPQPITRADRIEFARAALEEAAAKLSAEPYGITSSILLAAVTSRSRELTELRAAFAQADRDELARRRTGRPRGSIKRL